VYQNCPLLAQAANTIGHYAIRQRGTLGGSLAHADPAAQLPLVAVTLGAQLELRSVRGQRVVRAEEFFLSAMTTAMANDEILYSVRFPVAPHPVSAFKLFSRRQGDFAMVAVAAQMELQQDRVSRLCVGVGGVDGVPRNLSQHLSAFNGRHPDAAWISEIARATELAVQPVDDGRVDVLYRQELTRSLARQVFISALNNAQEGLYV
jgi:carbon-monoxide dehydrogenase medium subunit